jgi:hypothetical protein
MIIYAGPCLAKERGIYKVRTTDIRVEMQVK